MLQIDLVKAVLLTIAGSNNNFNCTTSRWVPVATSDVEMYEQGQNLLMSLDSFPHYFCVHVTVLPGCRKLPLCPPLLYSSAHIGSPSCKEVRMSRSSAPMCLTACHSGTDLVRT